MGLDRRETGLLLGGRMRKVSDGRGPLVREERGLGATSYQLSGKAMLGSHALKDK